ncbi:hypothetical protein LU298_13610 [Komagataeibacter intermedius]|uniref:hypothetical protein n=1 Tax=Komagataeibacter intermedius TaxID=66229 RepID=UPI0011466D93|nr:hypothetical protein [Komagataeibacter intermedius]MCF3637527.1 hypothetical protein [Komagataeibacter intermedius]
MPRAYRAMRDGHAGLLHQIACNAAVADSAGRKGPYVKGDVFPLTGHGLRPGQPDMRDGGLRGPLPCLVHAGRGVVPRPDMAQEPRGVQHDPSMRPDRPVAEPVDRPRHDGMIRQLP